MEAATLMRYLRYANVVLAVLQALAGFLGLFNLVVLDITCFLISIYAMYVSKLVLYISNVECFFSIDGMKFATCHILLTDYLNVVFLRYYCWHLNVASSTWNLGFVSNLAFCSRTVDVQLSFSLWALWTLAWTAHCLLLWAFSCVAMLF